MVGFVSGLSLGTFRSSSTASSRTPRSRTAVRAAVQVAEKGSKSNPYSIAVLKGDGAGPEVTDMTINVLNALAQYTDLWFDCEVLESGSADSKDFGSKFVACNIVFLSGLTRSNAVETHKYLRDELELFAQLRPVKVFPELVDNSSFKSEVVEGVDLMLVREISGGALVNESKPQTGDVGETQMVYTKDQITRVANVALQIAEARSGNLVNIDKAYAIKVSAFWRKMLHEYITESTNGRTDIVLEDMYIDDFCRAVLLDPQQFDVIVTSNLFGDIVAEVIAGLGGRMRLSPSTWISSTGLHVCGPADIYNSTAYPDGTGNVVVNPIGMIRSASMMLRYALDEPAAADIIQKSLSKTLEEFVTPDMHVSGDQRVVDAETFTTNLVASMEFMHQFEMVCDPTVCGE